MKEVRCALQSHSMNSDFFKLHQSSFFFFSFSYSEANTPRTTAVLSGKPKETYRGRYSFEVLSRNFSWDENESWKQPNIMG